MAAPALMLSTSSTRSNPKVLNGLRVAVPAYVFVTAVSGITRVAFKIDSSVVRTETAAPWDFNGTVSATGRAYIYDFTKLAAGKHTITATVTRNGTVSTLVATFTVVKPSASVAVPAVPAPGRASVPVPEVATPPSAPQPVLTVTSPCTVTHSPYVQDMSYTAIG